MVRLVRQETVVRCGGGTEGLGEKQREEIQSNSIDPLAIFTETVPVNESETHTGSSLESIHE